jgi:hypothetical protein
MAKNNNAPATKKDVLEIVNSIVMDATDKILKGMDRMFNDFRKEMHQTFATKEDLQREIGWVRDDINGLKQEFSNVTSRVDKHLPAN